MDVEKRFDKPTANVIIFIDEDVICGSVAGENWEDYPDKEDWND